ncbi:hypothetical protein SDA22_12320 [Legionella pneumophila serogroup 1]|uniref:hypothetical protein n=1 Tax=Legionellaceae TaxID=444 RepID=UPI00077074FB|nr:MULTISPECIES: hypothetical protein [Legionellaceae]HAT8868123.1 hypothetical protein [Legionella pneumophila subsp. pneumophila]MCK1848548.1 hypothetical protein [Legionella pneumophila]MCW8394026.1 hypothetical protein [Legionella pneumophila]MCW8462358.1 hypothetical protein [Fluoribacter dumoffii]MCW8493269.1 hypothetical protein [Legionella pneumophila]
MKKDKEKHQPVLESITADEPKTSSIALALQQFRKEAEKKEAAEEGAKARCPTCFKEIAPKRLCSGHGAGGSGGDSATSDKKTSEEKASPGEDKFLTKSGKVVGSEDELVGVFGSEELDLESGFDPEIIEKLIADGKLLVDSDRESMTLKLELQCDPNELTPKQRHELKKFMEAIINEFSEFKEDNHLSDDCIQILQDEKGNIHSLRITMPTLALYDAFIQHLANNLVPVPSPKAQERDEVTKEQSFAPNPLSKEPRPSNKDQSSTQEANEIHNKSEDGEQEIFNPSPFNMKPW